MNVVMKTVIAAAMAMGMATSAMAAVTTSQVADNYVTRTGVNVAGTSTWVPALEIRVNGVTTIVMSGTSGLTLNDVFNGDNAVAWVAANMGADVLAMSAGGGGGNGGNGLTDSEGGGGF